MQIQVASLPLAADLRRWLYLQRKDLKIMSFVLPQFKAPDFSKPPFSFAPSVRTEKATSNGVAPDSCHATSNHPEYVHLGDGRM
jgi:hypothetical protein